MTTVIKPSPETGSETFQSNKLVTEDCDCDFYKSRIVFIRYYK